VLKEFVGPATLIARPAIRGAQTGFNRGVIKMDLAKKPAIPSRKLARFVVSVLIPG
jgi:hypothetical protein